MARRDEAMDALRKEFEMYEYPWPRLLGADRAKWQQVHKFITEAAEREHKRDCSSFDGRKSVGPGPFGVHAERHVSRMRSALVSMIDAGIPKVLVEVPRTGRSPADGD